MSLSSLLTPGIVSGPVQGQIWGRVWSGPLGTLIVNQPKTQNSSWETSCTRRLKLQHVQALRVIQPKVIHVEYMPQARGVRSSLGKK